MEIKNEVMACFLFVFNYFMEILLWDMKVLIINILMLTFY